MSDSKEQEVTKQTGPMYINPNKNYGLIIPSKTKAQTALQKPKTTVKPCIFDEDDDEEMPNTSISNTKSKSTLNQVNTSSSLLKKQTQIQIEKALQEDQNVFEYDEIYDELEKEKHKIDPKLKKNESKEPKYIVGIMKAAAKRKLELEKVQERKIQKEREEEGDLWSDKEVFVTSAYRKKMEERQQIEEEERRQEQIENLLDVRKQKDLSGFYYSLLKMRTGEMVIEEEGEKEKRLEKERQEAIKFKENKSTQQKTYRNKNEQESDQEEEEIEAEPAKLDEQILKESENVTEKEVDNIGELEPKKMKHEETQKEEIKENIEPVEEIKLTKEEQRQQRLKKLFEKRTVGAKFDQELQEYFQRKSILAQKNYIERE
ncbi:unnamed protein product [Brachionus calyciflorus]|uniref:Nuclear speckle splicing regulatory protein 1 N-terminal domain-containing protein n=1 Tax=Brachionus calyciflorus TaxID=104777 RepID=A0A813M5Z0_9BILA|nr:unnamed protein product [Brachionus calyciflorus]